MASIKINDSVWNSISTDQQTEISNHLKQHKLLKAGDMIVGDSATSAPNSNTVVYGANYGEITTKGILTGPCKIICDGAAAAATAALTLTGPALIVAIAAIAAARDVCRNAC